MGVIVNQELSLVSMQHLRIGYAATAFRFEYCINLEIAQVYVEAAQDWG